MFSLKITDLSKRFGPFLLFKNLSFQVKSGEILAVTGWNGSGKSTLLRIIAGLERPSEGKIEIKKQDQPIDRENRRQHIGMVAPALFMYDELSAIENLEFFCRIRGITFNKNKCLELLDKIGLEKQSEKLCRKFSSGMKQRLKLAQAILHKPGILLLDEPGNNLDDRGKDIVKNIIKENNEKSIIILASNDKQEVDYAGRIINLSE